MATRATYRIKEIIPRRYFDGRLETDDIIQCFYIHWDGYPSGAIGYIEKALELYHKRSEHGQTRAGSFICSFGVVNEIAEFTKDHEEHGDTEYRYNIYFHHKDDKIHVEVMGSESFEGSFEEFKDKHRSSL